MVVPLATPPENTVALTDPTVELNSVPLASTSMKSFLAPAASPDAVTGA